MVTFDTNILVYATAAAPDAKAKRSRDLIVRGMQSGWSVLLLQTLAEFSNVAIRKAGIPIDDIRATIDAWRAVLPVQAAEDGDLTAALDAVKTHRLGLGMRCCGLRRNVRACGTCSPRTCRTASCCRASDSSTHSHERTID